MELYLKEIKHGSGNGITWLECLRTVNQEIVHSRLSIGQESLLDAAAKAYTELFLTQADRNGGQLTVTNQFLPMYRALVKRCTRTTLLQFSIHI